MLKELTALQFIISLAEHIDLLSDKEKLVSTLKQVHSLNSEERAKHEEALLFIKDYEDKIKEANRLIAFWQAEQKIADQKRTAAVAAQASLENTLNDIKEREEAIEKTKNLQAQQAKVWEKRDKEQREREELLNKRELNGGR